MNKKVRIGVIGTSGWAEFHINNLKKHPGADLTAVCGRNQANTSKIAQKYAIPQFFSDYRQMILTRQDLMPL